MQDFQNSEHGIENLSLQPATRMTWDEMNQPRRLTKAPAMMNAKPPSQVKWELVAVVMEETLEMVLGQLPRHRYNLAEHRQDMNPDPSQRLPQP